MRPTKVDRIRGRGSLEGLVGHAERVVMVGGRPRVVDKLPAPIDQHGIPRTDIMLTALLGQMATKTYVWTGKFDLHHMATPKADYTVIPGGVGRAFRGMSQQKLELPRQMHNLAHELFLTPYRPASEAVMRQALDENDQLKELWLVTEDGKEDPDKTLARVHDLLWRMPEPRVDIMPDREDLAVMQFDELRRTVGALIRVRRYGKKPFIHPAIRPGPALRHRVA